MESSRRPSLLIIEDEQGLRDMLQFGLPDYQVTTVSSGEAGIEKVRQQHFDLVLTDIMMPGISGVDVVRKIKEISSDTEVIVITGYPSLETSVTCMKAGAYDYLAKPFVLEHLNTVFQRALERHRLTVQLQHAQEISRIKSDFLIALSQSLTDPVNKILRTSTSMMEQASTAGLPSRVEGFKEIQVQAKQLTGLIQNILKLFDKPITETPLSWQAVVHQLKGTQPDVSGKHILLVDDDPSIVQLLELGLKQEGFWVETASDGREALTKMRAQKPDLVLLDLMLPELSGFGVLEAMAQDPALCQVRVVVITSCHLSPEETQQLQKQVERIIEKGSCDIRGEIAALLQKSPCQMKEMTLPPTA
ncbi:MAG: response regulator [Elusimicrobiota bacterium]|jgi:DNA-binding response OmpR family regulator